MSIQQQASQSNQHLALGLQAYYKFRRISVNAESSISQNVPPTFTSTRGNNLVIAICMNNIIFQNTSDPYQDPQAIRHSDEVREKTKTFDKLPFSSTYCSRSIQKKIHQEEIVTPPLKLEDIRKMLEIKRKNKNQGNMNKSMVIMRSMNGSNNLNKNVTQNQIGYVRSNSEQLNQKRRLRSKSNISPILNNASISSINFFSAAAAQKFIIKIFKNKKQLKSDYLAEIGDKASLHFKQCCVFGRCGEHSNGIRCMTKHMLFSRAFTSDPICRDLLIQIYDFFMSSHELFTQVVSFFFILDESKDLENQARVIKFCAHWIKERHFSFKEDNDLLFKMKAFLEFVQLYFFSKESIIQRPILSTDVSLSFFLTSVNQNSKSSFSNGNSEVDINLPSVLIRSSIGNNELAYRSEKRKGPPPTLKRSLNIPTNLSLKNQEHSINNDQRSSTCQQSTQSSLQLNQYSSIHLSKLISGEQSPLVQLRNYSNDDINDEFEFIVLDSQNNNSISDILSSPSRQPSTRKQSQVLAEQLNESQICEFLQNIQLETKNIQNILKDKVQRKGKKNEHPLNDNTLEKQKFEINFERKDDSELKEFERVMQLMDVDSEVLVQQLCLIEQEIFQKISIFELFSDKRLKQLNQFFQYHSREQTSIMKKRINLFTYFLILLIILQPSESARLKFYEKLLEISEQALNYKHFSLALEIYFALNSIALFHWIKLLKSNSSPLTKLRYDQLEKTISFNKSFVTLKNIMINTQPPFIPTLNIITRDLFQLEQQREDFVLENDKLYLEVVKFQEIAKVVKFLNSPKQERFLFPIKKDLHEFLKRGFESFMSTQLDMSDIKTLDIKLSELTKKKMGNFSE